MPSTNPSASRSAPAQAIIAPLSVQSAGGGIINVVCACPATACNAPRIAWLPAPPPAATRAGGGHASSAAQRARRAELLRKQPETDAQSVSRRFEHRRLKAGAEIANVLRLYWIKPAGLVAHRGLQSRQREMGVAAPEHRARKCKTLWIAARRCALDLRASWIGQTQHLRHLVESLAHRVIDGGAEPDIFSDAD